MVVNILSRDIVDLHSYLRWNSISKFIDPTLSTLDVGCNIGTMTIELAKLTNNSVVGVDIDMNCIKLAENRAECFLLKNCEFFFGDATCLPFPDGSFEQILLADILEHVTADYKVIEECFRVLKPYGKLIINVPRPNYSQLFNPDWIRQIGHVRDGYELSQIESLITGRFKIDNFEFNSRAREELDAFYNNGQQEITDQRLEALFTTEKNIALESYGLTISTTRIEGEVIKHHLKPKILHVGWGHPPNYGAGPIYYLQNLCLQQQAKGLSVSCFVAGNEKGDGNIPTIIRKTYDGVIYDIVQNRPTHYFDWSNPIREVQNIDIEKLFLQTLENVRPAIVHFHNLIGLSMSLPEIAKKFGCTTIMSVHNYWMMCTRDDLFATNETICPGPGDGARCAACVNNDKLIIDFMMRTSIARKIFAYSLDAILAVSEKVKKILLEFGVAEEKIFVQHIGSKAAEDNWIRQSYNTTIQKKNGRILRFGFLGTVSCRKGPHIVLDAVNNLGKLTSNFEVRIHGYCPPGAYEDRLNSMIEKSEILRNHVRLMGGYKQDQIFEISQSLDIAIIPPIWEDNAPQTVMEALASGLPVIGSNVGGIPDFVRDGENGLLFKVGDPNDLCARMLEIIEDENLLNHLQKGIEAPKSMNSHIEDILSLYEKIIQNVSLSVDLTIEPREAIFTWDAVKSFQQLNEAETHIFEKDIDGALKLLSGILQFEPINCNALNDLAVVNILENNLEYASELINTVLRIEPTNEIALGNKNCFETPLTTLQVPKIVLNKISSYKEYVSYCNMMKNEFRDREAYERSLLIKDGSFTIRGYCIVCKSQVDFLVDLLYSTEVNGIKLPNWRERLVCPKCNLNNRNRASIHLIQKIIQPDKQGKIFVAEQTTPLYKYLKKNYPNALGSEYLGDKIKFGSSGSDGIRNEDFTNLMFGDDEFDNVFSFDVFEHIHEFKKAFTETYRILKPGGKLLFTVPFNRNSETNLTRAIFKDGQIEHVVPPEYHGDPLNPSEGCLCYYHFGWEVLAQLKDVGFENSFAYTLYSKECGHLGEEQLFIVAEK